MDWEDEEDRKPRHNPFSDEGDFDLIDPGFSWVSKEEVADFMKQSRGLSLSDAGADDDDAELGEAWGGTQFSITSGECSVVVFCSFSPESQNILPSLR